MEANWQMASLRRLGQQTYFRVFEENRKKYEDKWSEAHRAEGTGPRSMIELEK